jgi:hypothetical protein
MAGRPGYKAKYDELLKRFDKVNAENVKLKNIIASLDPDILEQGRPTPLTKYDDTVPKRVLAMADSGQLEDQWISAFGISAREWHSWVQEHPELQEAVEKAEVRVLAWWDEGARKAQVENNNRFAVGVHERITKRLRERIEARQRGEAGLGDASRLVVLDLRSTVP